MRRRYRAYPLTATRTSGPTSRFGHGVDADNDPAGVILIDAEPPLGDQNIGTASRTDQPDIGTYRSVGASPHPSDNRETERSGERPGTGEVERLRGRAGRSIFTRSVVGSSLGEFAARGVALLMVC